MPQPYAELTALDVVRGFQGLRALVVGDAMIDCYLDGVATRLCKEGPVPVLVKAGEHHAPGGAANVAVNLRALGAEVVFVGLVGRDPAAGELRAALRERGVDDSWLVEDADCATIRKTRVLADDQYLVRLDEGETRSCSDDGRRRVLQAVEAAFPRCDLVVVPDYGYGVASEVVIAELRQLRTSRAIPFAVDAKDVRPFAKAGVTVVTPNFAEACVTIGEPPPIGSRSVEPALAERVGRRLLEVIDAEYAAVTLAGEGVMLVGRNGVADHLPAHAVAHAGDVGAGDTFTAALALALASGADPVQAARIGIDAAGIAVTQRRTSAVQHQELLRRVSLDGPVPSAPLKTLAAILDAERYAGKTIVFTNGVFDILHAGHVQILQRAKRLGDVLVVGLNSDASVRRLKGEARPINHERDRLALVAALDPVDHAILFEEDTPADLIRALRPHVHVKGGDYTAESLPEIDAVREVGARVEILSLVEGRSTTNVIRKIVTLAADGLIEAAP
ncbi:MAG: D-beta-D-heptose 7-phosphate kinase / D-beta-D-heptose 1-phosphate adenosyltransferase [Thermomicrobiales bacterium]|jgi:D-beta-D-heptose 7-phosphate kinase/D-beta-D-heptose 1-phosphate adenosyltransferase|nr:D-beta-D-heptose 7-phosphate kinase / D-beta-D-heptose 1-phosphate adenosyltransferase [Thermomicrobiales bacterium]